MIRIVIADDHQLIRDGLRRLIEEERDLSLLGEASSAGEVMELLGQQAADVLVLDISLPDRDGIEVLKDLKAQGMPVRVLMLSMHPEARYAKRALRNGAAGYITKDSASETIIAAIRAVYERGSYITEEVAEELYRDIGSEEVEQPHDRLSDREYQILLRIGGGTAVREISEELSLSVNTVNSYRRRILEKLQLGSSAEIVRYTVEHDLI
jgi:DNA-binding NarL/FixJ family response regulator